MTTTDCSLPVPFREVTDRNGRGYRVGESDVDLMGRTRAWMVVLPWVAMTSAGAAACAFAAAGGAHVWSDEHVFRLLGVWMCLQAAVALPAGRLRVNGRLTARTALLIGACAPLTGWLFLAALPGTRVGSFGFAVCGGLGAGLVQVTCVSLVGTWCPERKGGRTGLVSGGFAVGSAPFLFLFAASVDLARHQAVCVAVGVGLCLVVASAGRLLQDPPKNWWPDHVDPLRRPVDPTIRRALERNPPAAKQRTSQEAARTPVLWLMWLCLLGTAGVNVFGVVVQVSFAEDLGFPRGTVGTAVAFMALVNGVGLGAVGRLSDRYGRRNTLVLACVVLGTAQFGVLVAGERGSGPFLLFWFLVCGLGGAAVFPLCAAMTADFFGENDNASHYGLVHSSTLVSGPVGVGLGAAVAGGAWSCHGALVLAGSAGLACAVPALFLKSPGRMRVRRIVPNPQPLGEEMA
ncbi:MFS transporter [Streptomyces sp. NPDC087212]|uniref:MFS transporter n=1 Tax=Streptomyces sp. NPDC087212 TaxID=3365766 RepID=UPI0038159050